jgi:hypothetical protein
MTPKPIPDLDTNSWPADRSLDLPETHVGSTSSVLASTSTAFPASSDTVSASAAVPASASVRSPSAVYILASTAASTPASTRNPFFFPRRRLLLRRRVPLPVGPV